jgi:fructokinase
VNETTGPVRATARRDSPEPETAAPPEDAARIVISGENVADLLPAHDGLLRVALGGGPANTAVAAAGLGGRVSFLARLGVDDFARQFRERLTAAGVDLAGAYPLDAPSAVALAAVDAAGVAKYDFWLDGAADFAATELPDAPPGAVAHAASITAYWPPGADHVAAWLARARSLCTVTFDVNLRPVVLARQADALVRLEQLVRLAHVVKASDEDIELAYPGRPPSDVAAAWLDAGADLVVFTHGAAGASAHVAGEAVVLVPAPRIEVADTIGAGDAAMAALLVRLATAGLAGVIGTRVDTLRYMCAAAAVACTRHGAYAPTPAEVAALLATAYTSEE